MWEDEIGKRYGKLEVQSVYRRDKVIYAKCKCDCGNEKEARLDCLRTGHTTSCGCSRIARLEGKRFGKLVVVKFLGIKNRKAYWLCKCDCGNETTVPSAMLTSGNTKSCGCGMRDHAEKCLEDMEKNTRVGSLLRKEGKRNTSGRVGVYWYKRRKKWSAEIIFQKQRYMLGFFENFEDACKAREAAEQRTHKNFLEWYAKEHPEKTKKVNDKISQNKKTHDKNE